MPCYHPLSAWRCPDSGSIEFVDRGRGDRLDLPCGRCIGCRLERSRQWATRIMFESQFHGANSFITLTYDDEHMPFPPSLHYPHFQKFMKRARKSLGPLRFFMCGEYGEEFFRPHYHACIFGTDFPDRVLWERRPTGDVFRSPALERLWPFGYSSVCELNFQTAAYVARYVLKKVTGDAAEAHYRFVDVETGEVHQRVPEFAHMSLKPGIGGPFFDRYKDDIFPHDFVVVNGVKCRPPRYFDKLLRRSDVAEFDFLKSDRSCNPLSVHNSDSRLVVREQVQLAALKQLSPRGDL